MEAINTEITNILPFLFSKKLFAETCVCFHGLSWLPDVLSGERRGFNPEVSTSDRIRKISHGKGGVYLKKKRHFYFKSNIFIGYMIWDKRNNKQELVAEGCRPD